jgi:hypothetical protein
MWTVKFVDNGTYAVQHSIDDTDGLNNVKLSADKLSGINYFTREPKRLTFDCLVDSWITANLLDGEHEQTPYYISSFEVQLYKGNTLLFHGILDTSGLSDDGSGLLSLTCYSKLFLFTKFPEIKKLYTLSDGYTCSEILGYYLAHIETHIESAIPKSYLQTDASFEITEAEVIHSISQADLAAKASDYPKPNDDVNTPYKASETLFVGFDENAAIPTIVSYVYQEWQVGSGPTQLAYLTFRAEIFKYYNKTGWVLAREYDKSLDWFTATWSSWYTWFEDHCDLFLSTYGMELNDEAVTEITPGDDQYTITPNSGLFDVAFKGETIPAKIFPKGFYDGENKQVEELNIVKAMLLLHNLTIVSAANGTLQLRSKDASSGEAIEIETADITGTYRRTRLQMQIPDMSVFDNLMGDMTFLKEKLAAFYKAFFYGESGLFQITINIDQMDKYALGLFNIIEVDGEQYRIVEIRTDHEEDEYQIVGWSV